MGRRITLLTFQPISSTRCKSRAGFSSNLNAKKLIKHFTFKNETPSAMPGVMFSETFSGQVQFPDTENEEDEEPFLLWLFRDGVECRTPPVSVGLNEWQTFVQRCIHEALNSKQ